MKKLILASLIASAFAGTTTAFAEEKSPHTLTGNVGIVNDYRFRGISQTFAQPAIQGGFDYSHASGIYLGTWASNVYGGSNGSGLGVDYNNGSMEWDFYGGYKWDLGPVALDAGVLRYQYPGAKWTNVQRTSFNNTEVYMGGTWKWFTLKYSSALTDYFGTNQQTVGGACGVLANGTASTVCAPARAGGSKGSNYWDLSGNFELPMGFNLVAHVGKVQVKNYSLFNYTDYKIGVTKEIAGLTWGLAYIDSNAKADVYRTVKAEGGGNNVVKDMSKGTAVLSVSKTF